MFQNLRKIAEFKCCRIRIFKIAKLTCREKFHAIKYVSRQFLDMKEKKGCFFLQMILEIRVVILWVVFILLLLLKAVDSAISPSRKIIKRVKSYRKFSSSALCQEQWSGVTALCVPLSVVNCIKIAKNHSDLVNASLSNDDGDGNENGKKR